MSRSRYKFGETAYPHFITCTIVGWQPVFTRPDLVEIVLDSWRFLHDRERMRLLGYVILENHLHLIATSENLSKEVGDFKHNNPVRRGYVDDPIHWRYSSARNYSKLPALVPVIVDWM